MSTSTPNILGEGPIEKMVVTAEEPVRYTLAMGEHRVAMNDLLDRPLILEYLGTISCVHCGRTTKKSFNQGYCYPCFTRLAQCDVCIVKPELCHFHEGTCREPEWGETHCMMPHTVYLSNSSGVKVGITRGVDPTTRWIDQGAAQGLAIRTVPNRLEAGKLEVAFKAHANDKTDWRKMLRGSPESVDLRQERDRLLEEIAATDPGFAPAGHQPEDAAQMEIHYPVLEHPTKIVSHNLDKKPVLEGTLKGIKGQYLIFDTCLINMRKYGGYHLRLSETH